MSSLWRHAVGEVPTDGLCLQQCPGCRSFLFPARLCCPNCGASDLLRIRVTRGRIEDITTRPGADHAIATVTSHGAALIARVPSEARVGDDIDLTNDAQRQDAAFVPDPGPDPFATHH
ncbi:hypothetical protein FS847_01210 [Streptomyces sp. ISID311]|nr:hypothetical protein FS847_01210 [Streptomyces sp. ISID311]